MKEIYYYMDEALLKVDSKSTVTDAAKYMLKNKVSSLLVEENEKITGIVTDVDFCHKVIAADRNPDATTLSEIKSSPLVTLESKKSMDEAFVCMRKNNVRHIVITENKKVVGILSMKDFGNYYNYRFEEEKRAIEEETEASF